MWIWRVDDRTRSHDLRICMCYYRRPDSPPSSFRGIRCCFHDDRERPLQGIGRSSRTRWSYIRRPTDSPSTARHIFALPLEDSRFRLFPHIPSLGRLRLHISASSLPIQVISVARGCWWWQVDSVFRNHSKGIDQRLRPVHLPGSLNPAFLAHVSRSSLSLTFKQQNPATGAHQVPLVQ
ncbi:hypothetical protein VTJ04DRAFT_1723 [Mycothermus thermophilus]|uniref:uncharacterized protein n=1 Tax=Humicola insolens TaxID=85995 RepID=UPI003742D8F3